ncbi:hypothetical protein TWF679_010067 [Orbilia oligospora]|uniref:Uncharacterized protein n=1 Tax=Orbilia oligospora TaxID=2813651 RepID=A0A8H8V198_ORBOL|nr:hypothetical protein TWF679_010067 [Orbilia oligospora]
MDTIANEPIPKPHSRANKGEIVTAIFGPEEDPNQPPRADRFKHMQTTAKETYHRIISPDEKFRVIYWDRIPHNAQQRAIEDLLKNEVFGSYFARSEKYWLPKYLMKNYIKSHVDHKIGRPGDEANQKRKLLEREGGSGPRRMRTDDDDEPLVPRSSSLREQGSTDSSGRLTLPGFREIIKLAEDAQDSKGGHWA